MYLPKRSYFSHVKDFYLSNIQAIPSTHELLSTIYNGIFEQEQIILFKFIRQINTPLAKSVICRAKWNLYSPRAFTIEQNI